MNHDTTVARRKSLLLMAVGEEMMLVVRSQQEVGTDEIHAVVVVLAHLRGHAARQGTVTLAHGVAHPFEGQSFVVGHGLGVGVKARGKHLGQHDEVAFANALQQMVQVCEVRFGLSPNDVRL